MKKKGKNLPKHVLKQAPSKYGTIISVRVTDDEIETIWGIRASTRRSISDIMKEAFVLYLAQKAGAHPGRAA
jgi:hypothetical protein